MPALLVSTSPLEANTAMWLPLLLPDFRQLFPSTPSFKALSTTIHQFQALFYSFLELQSAPVCSAWLENTSCEFRSARAVPVSIPALILCTQKTASCNGPFGCFKGSSNTCICGLVFPSLHQHYPPGLRMTRRLNFSTRWQHWPPGSRVPQPRPGQMVRLLPFPILTKTTDLV